MKDEDQHIGPPPDVSDPSVTVSGGSQESAEVDVCPMGERGLVLSSDIDKASLLEARNALHNVNLRELEV